MTALYDREPSFQEVMEKVIDDKVLLIEAKKYNLYPDRTETLEYMLQIRSVREKAKNEDVKIDEESEKNWQLILRGQGLTEEEYWKSENTIRGYQAALAIARVRNKLAQEWGFSAEKMSTSEDIAKYEDSLNRMVSEQKNKLKVEYLEPVIGR